MLGYILGIYNFHIFLLQLFQIIFYAHMVPIFEAKKGRTDKISQGCISTSHFSLLRKQPKSVVCLETI